MKTKLDNLKKGGLSVFSAHKARLRARNASDRAGVFIQAVVLTSGLAFVGLLVVFWMTTTIQNKGVDAAECIEGAASTYSSEADTSQCDDDVTKNRSFKNDSSYSSRY